MLELFWLCFWRTWSTSLYVKLLDQVILDSIILFFFFCHNKLSAHSTDLELWRSEVR